MKSSSKISLAFSNFDSGMDICLQEDIPNFRLDFLILASDVLKLLVGVEKLKGVLSETSSNTVDVLFKVESCNDFPAALENFPKFCEILTMFEKFPSFLSSSCSSLSK